MQTLIERKSNQTQFLQHESVHERLRQIMNELQEVVEKENKHKDKLRKVKDGQEKLNEMKRGLENEKEIKALQAKEQAKAVSKLVPAHCHNTMFPI